MRIFCILNGIWLTLQHLDMADYGFLYGCELEEQDTGDVYLHILKCKNAGG